MSQSTALYNDAYLVHAYVHTCIYILGLKQISYIFGLINIYYYNVQTQNLIEYYVHIIIK